MRNLNLEMAARNGAKQERDPYDFYATDPKTVELFLNQIKKDGLKIGEAGVWECACGNGHISKVLKEKGYNVISTDIMQREFPCEKILDFLSLKQKINPDVDTIMTNPPYKHATKFALKALEISSHGDWVILYLKDRFLEGVERYEKIFKKYPPKYVYCHVDRQNIAMRGEFSKYCKNSNTQFFIWCIWRKGYDDKTELRWIK